MSCKYCSAINHQIDDCVDPELAKLASEYLTYQYKSTPEFETYIRGLPYHKFFATAYFCSGYNENEIHPTEKKDIVKRMIELHIFTKNTQGLQRMTWRHIQTPPIIINVHRNNTNDPLLLEGYQIDMLKQMNHQQIRDFLYLVSRGHNSDTTLNSFFPPPRENTEEMMRDDAIEGLMSMQNETLENLHIDEILQMRKITWTNYPIQYGEIDCPICYLSVSNNICKYNCNHCFCRDCTCKSLMSGSKVCSLCRTTIQNIQHYSVMC